MEAVAEIEPDRERPEPELTIEPTVEPRGGARTRRQQWRHQLTAEDDALTEARPPRRNASLVHEQDGNQLLAQLAPQSVHDARVDEQPQRLLSAEDEPDV